MREPKDLTGVTEILYNIIEEWLIWLYVLVKVHQSVTIKICVFHCIKKIKNKINPPPNRKKKKERKKP